MAGTYRLRERERERGIILRCRIFDSPPGNNKIIRHTIWYRVVLSSLLTHILHFYRSVCSPVCQLVDCSSCFLFAFIVSSGFCASHMWSVYERLFQCMRVYSQNELSSRRIALAHVCAVLTQTLFFKQQFSQHCLKKKSAKRRIVR